MKKILLMGLGFICLGLAILGVILPVMPTTCFVLMAAACFAKSSPRFYNWLLNSALFGPMIRNWQNTRSMPKRAKIMAIGTIIMSGGISIYLISSANIQALVIALLLIPIAIILKVRTTEDLCPIKIRDR